MGPNKVIGASIGPRAHGRTSTNLDEEEPTAVRLVDRDQAPDTPELSEELRLAFSELAGAAREGLLAMSVSVGMRVLIEMMEEELTAKVGPKHAKIPGRSATRHASAPGSVVLGGRRVGIQRPRARTTDDTY